MSSINTHSAPLDVDVLVIGAGFGGTYALYLFRKLGFKTHLFEAGKSFGGVWNWNRYPGARVDSEIPYYQFSIPEIWKTFNWRERFPGHEELREYFAHVDKVLDLSKDCSFEHNVVGAKFDEKTAKWIVTTENGITGTCKYLIAATGSSYKRHYPDFKNWKSYKGIMYHSAFWPAEGVEAKGKRVAVVGAGATGVQCVQELGKDADHLGAYIRTQCLSLPMVQRKMSAEEQDAYKSIYKSIFRLSRQTSTGLGYDTTSGKMTDASEAEREALFEELWARGGFNFNVGNYRDYLVDPKSNRIMYDFWAKKVRQRIKNPEKRAFLAPDEPPFAFGTKRSSLEQDYYEVLDQDHVEIIALNKTPIREFTEKGIVTEDGKEREYDIIVLATGYDSMTGSLTGMGLTGRDGIDMKDRWRDGVFTYLGMTASGCPNMFMIYGPQAPTAFTNGPVFIELQVEFVADVIQKMQKEGIKTLEPTREAEEKWKQDIQDMNEQTLFPLTNSWYMGANIPGKKREQLNYIGGVQNYEKACREALEDNFKGFKTVKA